MFRKLTFLMNAAFVGGLAGFAAHTVAPISTNLLPASVTEKSRSPIATRSVATQTVTPPSLIRTGAIPGTAGSKTANLLSSSSPDAIVPPIVRHRPSNGTSVAAADPTTEKKTAKKTKAEKAAAKATKLAAGTTGTVKTAALSPSPKQPIDLSGRSALGVGPKAVQGAAPKGIKCNAGLKYDAKQLKCVAAPAPNGTAPKLAKATSPAKATPAASP